MSGQLVGHTAAPTTLEDMLGGVAGGGDELAWQRDNLCAQTDPEAFFPEKGGTTASAKRVCMGCPVRAECLEYALARDERFGVWGGLSERERRRLGKSRQQAATTAEQEPALQPQKVVAARQSVPRGEAPYRSCCGQRQVLLTRAREDLRGIAIALARDPDRPRLRARLKAAQENLAGAKLEHDAHMRSHEEEEGAA